MNKLQNENSTLEVLLSIYFSEQKELYLRKEFIEEIDGFVNFCAVQDRMNQTDDVRLLEMVYTENLFASKAELLKNTAMSEAGFYRFRLRMIKAFGSYLQIIAEHTDAV